MLGCPPKSEIESWSITGLDAQKIDTACNVKIVSQWVLPLPIVEIKGTVSSQNKELATLHLDPGTATVLPAGGTVHAIARSTATYANMANILSTTNYGPGSEVPITIKAKVTVRLSNNSNWDFPDLTINGVIPILMPPTAWLDGAPTFSTITKDNCTGRVKVKVNNPNKFALSLRELSGGLRLKELGSNPPVYRSLTSFTLASPVTIAAQQSSTMTFDVHFVPSTLFDGPQVPPTPSGNPVTNFSEWATWGATVISRTASSVNLPPASVYPDDWIQWANGLVRDWWGKLLDSMTPADNYKASFSTKFRTPHAPFDIPFSLGN